MKNFYFNFEDGLEQKYIDWAKEAVQDFINLFPEYKDNFATDEKNISYASLDVLQALAEKNKQIYEERKRTQQSTEDFDEKSFWQMFDKLPDSSYKASLKNKLLWLPVTVWLIFKNSANCRLIAPEICILLPLRFWLTLPNKKLMAISVEFLAN